MLLYHHGLSYCDTGKILGFLKPTIYKSVHYWYKQFRDLFVVGKKERRSIALDETKIILKGDQVYLWTDVDVYNKDVLTMYLLRIRCGLDKYFFIKKVFEFCDCEPLVISDKATCYPWAILLMGLRVKYAIGKRNAVK